MDAVQNAANALMSIGSNEPLSGGQMFDEVTDRKFERQTEASPPPTVEQAPQKNDDVDYYKNRIAELERRDFETRSLVERQTGQFQAWLQAQQQQQHSRPVELPNVEVDDPSLAAALNTLDKRFDMKLQQFAQHQQQSEYNRLRQSESQRFEQALQDVSEITKFYTKEQLQQFAAPYINDPRFAGHDWKKELSQVLSAAKAPVLEAENQELRKKLDAVEKRKEADRQQQKQNLKLVPGIGQRSGGQQQSRSLGEQILSEFKGKGRGQKPSYKQFGAELLKRISAQ